MTVAETARKDPDSLIGRAYRLAERAHAGQKRKTGEPYFSHPLAVAEVLASWQLDEPSIAAGLLHDVVEDTAVSAAELEKDFGEEIAFLVDGITKLGRVKYRGPQRSASDRRADDEHAKVENLRKMILAIGRDLRVIFVKLADRLHNMRTLRALPPAKQKRIALETDQIYAPIAYRLGMQNVSGELYDLAFPYLHPKEFEWLKTSAAEEFESRGAYLESIRPTVLQELKDRGLEPVAVDFRAKRYHSLYKKLLVHEMDMEKIYDLVAFRIIAKTVEDCYAILGTIHQLWPPLPGRIKDYIAMPKPNGYRSLHTTVFGPGGKNIEFQIRTKEMHEEDENGIAAHWIYEQRRGGGRPKHQEIAQEVRWVEQLRAWQDAHRERMTNPEKFLETMKADFFKDRIFAITPRGDAFDLPAEATPVDFAYHIHSEVGNNAVGAKVNGRIVPLDQKLESGDMVEILTQKNKSPSEDWLKFVKTSIARDHVRSALRAKSHALRDRHAPAKTELRIAVENRMGLIKDISTAIARSHVNIVSFRTYDPKGGKYSVNKVEVGTADKEKIEGLVVKLKKIPNVREVGYRPA